MTPAEIIAETAAKHGLKVNDLCSRRRAAVPAKKEATIRLLKAGYSPNQRTTAMWRAKH